MMADNAAERLELLDRIGALRTYVHDELSAAVLSAAPNKGCLRLVAGLLDNLNNLEAVLANER